MQMTREKATQYKDELVDLYYRRIISWDEYNKRWDDIELLPYDLSAFPQLKETTITWINKLFEKAPELSKRGNFMLRGFTRCEGAEVRVFHLTYGDYADAIAFYAYNDEEMMIYEFTEGDVTLQLFSDRESYEKEKQATYEWYKEERGVA